VIAKLVQQLGFNYVAVLYLSDGADFASYLQQILQSQYNISSITVEFTYGLNDDDIDSAVKQVASLGLNVVICATWSGQLPEIAVAAVKYGLTQETNHWIFTYMSRMLVEADYEATPQLLPLMNGSMWVTTDLSNNANWDNWIAQWPTFSTIIPWYNANAPPYGQHNSITQCKNAEINFTLRSDFFTDTTYLQNTIWTYAYDIVLAYGMAMCHDNDNGPVPNGTELYRIIMNNEFVGLSGSSLRFINTTGDRDPNTAGFSFFNWNGTNGTTMGRWDPVKGEFIINPNVVFKSGVGLANVPKAITPPPDNENYLPQWARVLGYVELGLLMFSNIACFLWLLVYRNEKVVHRGQAALLHFINLGCAVASWAILPLTVDDGPGNTMDPNAACMAAPVLFSLGMGIAIGALTVKTYRIWKVFHNPKLKRLNFTLRRALAIVTIFLTLLAALLISWIVAAPLVWQRTVLYANAQGFVIESVGTCSASTASGAFLIVVFIIFFVSLIAAAFGAYTVYQFPSEFHEARYILLALLSLAQVYLCAVPTIVAVYNYVIGKFIITTLVVFVSASFVNGLLLYPKMYRVHTGRDLWVEATSLTVGPGTPASPAAGPSHVSTGMVRMSARVKAEQQE